MCAFANFKFEGVSKKPLNYPLPHTAEVNTTTTQQAEGNAYILNRARLRGWDLNFQMFLGNVKVPMIFLSEISSQGAGTEAK